MKLTRTATAAVAALALALAGVRHLDRRRR